MKYDLKDAKKIAQKVKIANEIVKEGEAALDELGVSYDAKKLLIENPDVEIIDDKDCSVKYLTDYYEIFTGYGVQKVTVKDGKVCVEKAD